MHNIIKKNTVNLEEPIMFNKIFRGSSLEFICTEIKKRIKRRIPHLSNTIECRERMSEDYKNTYIGEVEVRYNKKKAKFKVYLQEHYFFNPKIKFKKVGAGGIGFLPYEDRIHMNEIIVK